MKKRVLIFLILTFLFTISFSTFVISYGMPCHDFIGPNYDRECAEGGPASGLNEVCTLDVDYPLDSGRRKCYDCYCVGTQSETCDNKGYDSPDDCFIGTCPAQSDPAPEYAQACSPGDSCCEGDCFNPADYDCIAGDVIPKSHPCVEIYQTIKREDGYYQELTILEGSRDQLGLPPSGNLDGNSIKQGSCASINEIPCEDIKHLEEKYVDQLKIEENSLRKGFENGKWYPHPSPEGGTDTVAYGHKLKQSEINSGKIIGKNANGQEYEIDYVNGITEEAAEDILRKDREIARNSAKPIINQKLADKGINLNFDELDEKYQLALEELAFNVGEGTFQQWNAIYDAFKIEDEVVRDQKFLKEYRRGWKDNKGKRHYLDPRVSRLATVLGLANNPQEALEVLKGQDPAPNGIPLPTGSVITLLTGFPVHEGEGEISKNLEACLNLRKGTHMPLNYYLEISALLNGEMEMETVVFVNINDSDPEKDGSISLYLTVTLDGFGTAAIEKLSEEMDDVDAGKVNNPDYTGEMEIFNYFTFKDINGNEFDIVREIISIMRDPTIKGIVRGNQDDSNKGGSLEGTIRITTKPIEGDNNHLRLMITQKLKQEYTFSSNTLQGDEDKLEAVTKELAVVSYEEAIRFSRLYSQKWDEVISDDTIDADIVIAEDGGTSTHQTENIKVKKTVEYYENSDRDNIYDYVLLRRGQKKKVNEEAPKTESTSKTQSVWMVRDSFNLVGEAYWLYPDFEFNNSIKIIFGGIEGEVYHFEDSLLNHCNYTIIESRDKLIGLLGETIELGNIKQIFTRGAVEEVSLFGIRKINISSCDHWVNGVKDGGEDGIDCGPCEITCYDGIQNQDETGIDCGGTCFIPNVQESCGFDFNNDCSMTPCIPLPINCSSNNDCIFAYSKNMAFGKCLNKTCERTILGPNQLINDWKNESTNLKNTMFGLKKYILEKQSPWFNFII